jgi:protein-tyrosine phosphatase
MSFGNDEASHAGFSDELRVDWIGPDAFADGLAGRLGLTFLPGKSGPSFRYPGRIYRRDVDRDLAALRAMGVGRLILLVEDHELELWSDPTLVSRGAAAGVDVLRHPLPDGLPPRTRAEMRAILDEIREGRSNADVAVACMGGVGRSGTVAACALVDAGLSAAAAIATVRAVRHPRAVETAAQERFVEEYAAAGRNRP